MAWAERCFASRDFPEQAFATVQGMIRLADDHDGPRVEALCAEALDRLASGFRRWFNNRAENSHQPFRRREGAMARFRDIKTLQKFASVHASIHNHFNHQRHLNRRDIFKQGRAAALAEWRQLAA